jgi:hypothetical protein
MGLYAVSTHLWARTRGHLAAKFGKGPQNWTEHVQPRAVVGHAYYIYEIAPPR